MASRAARRIAYLTDVEGMWNKLESFARGNPDVSLEGDRLSVREGVTFVFGGDAIDRGPSGRRVVRALLDVKRRQPEQVVLLAGNRDLNKLRLWRELQGHPLPRVPGALRDGSARAPLLRWIFEHTMGARAAFEFRRDELRAEGRASDDEAVAQSYLTDLAPGGDLRELLRLGQLAFRADQTLFVHGGVTEESLYVTPHGAQTSSVDDWVGALNRWYRDQLQAFAEDREVEPDRPGWAPVIAYQAPVPGTRRNRGSVVYGRTADADNNPLLPPDETVRALQSDGVHRLVVGHTPNGDTPSLLRRFGFEMVVGDTSHSRIDTAPRVTIAGPALEAEGETALEDGSRHRLRMALSLGDDSPIGLRDSDEGYLVKGQLEDGRYLLFRYLPHFQFEQRAEEEAALRRRPLRPPEVDRAPDRGDSPHSR